MSSLHANRRARLQQLLGTRAGLITNAANVRYLSGYTGSNGLLCFANGEGRLLTDFRYANSVEPLRSELTVEIVDQALLGDVAARFGDLLGRGTVAFESDHLSHASWLGLDAAARAAGAALEPASGLVEGLRAVKDADEIARIAAGAQVTDAVYAYLSDLGLAGRSEAEVARLIADRMLELGAQGPAFPSIVAAGANGASPHAVPGADEIERDTLVVIDIGARVDGYCSDCTRTFAIGHADEAMREVYAVVLAAQEAALAAVQPGASCIEVHEIARRVIADAGYAEHFNHGTGHGLGVEIHEEPRFRAGHGGELRPGNVVTVEPGVYLPGRFGVRIEDLVVVTETGHDVLTSFPKSLLTID